jgi:hypothetical protein
MTLVIMVRYAPQNQKFEEKKNWKLLVISLENKFESTLVNGQQIKYFSTQKLLVLYTNG